MGKFIFALVIFALAGAIFVLYTEPTYAEIGTLQSQIAQYNGALDKATQLQKLKESLLAKYNSFNTNDINRLQTMLPDHVDNIALILDLNNLASRYGMALENVDVSVPGSDTSSSGSTIGSTAGSSKKYASITMHFSTFGTYQDLLTFLQGLESSLRIVDLTQLTLSPQGTGTGGPSTYRYDMTLQTYWLQ